MNSNGLREGQQAAFFLATVQRSVLSVALSMCRK
jgi:hypothetical protein